MTRLYDDLDEYREAIANTGRWDPDDLIRHELAHVACAKAVGIPSPRVGFLLDPFGRPSQCITVLGDYRRVPRLALAAVFLAPEYPSASDIESVAMLGYPSIGEVARRIDSWNDSQTLQIPAPGFIV